MNFSVYRTAVQEIHINLVILNSEHYNRLIKKFPKRNLIHQEVYIFY